MQFDPENKVIKLCGEGMMAEGEANPEKAYNLFQQAWDSASNDFEAALAAHYMARHQDNPADTLKWNLESLNRAMLVKDEDMNQLYPSLYLNAGKSYEDLGDIKEAGVQYKLAADFASFLPADGYGNMIRAGIEAGLNRTFRTEI
jgi:hypothetical protein